MLTVKLTASLSISKLQRNYLDQLEELKVVEISFPNCQLIVLVEKNEENETVPSDKIELPSHAATHQKKDIIRYMT